MTLDPQKKWVLISYYIYNNDYGEDVFKEYEVQRGMSLAEVATIIRGKRRYYPSDEYKFTLLQDPEDGEAVLAQLLHDIKVEEEAEKEERRRKEAAEAEVLRAMKIIENEKRERTLYETLKKKYEPKP